MYTHIYNNLLGIVHGMIGHNLTDTSQLKSIGKSLFGAKFTGVFARDKIPSHFTYVICNLDKTGRKGSHWLAIAKVSETPEYLVYDSFGRRTSDILPELLLPTIDTDNDAEQADNEKDCGQRCLAWLSVFHLFGPQAAMTI